MRLSRNTLALTIVCALAPHASAERAFSLSEARTSVRLVSEEAQWAPESVTVINRDEIDATYRRDAEYLEGYSPSLLIDRNLQTPGGSVLAIRGIGSSEADMTFAPAVATYIDGVYVASHSATMVNAFDLEQVEVARGPQLFLPAPAMAGAVSYTRSRPTGEWGIEARTVVGAYDRIEAAAVINLPVLAGIATKVSLDFGDDGGRYMTNLVVPRDENTEEMTAYAVSFLWAERDDLEIQYTYDNLSDDSTTPALLNLSGDEDILCNTSPNRENCRSPRGPAVPQLISLDLTAQNASNVRSYQLDAHSLRIKAELGDTVINSITAFRDSDDSINNDLDATQADFYTLIASNEFEQVSQEISLFGKLSDSLLYTLGYYYLDTDHQLNQEEAFVAERLTSNGLSPGYVAGDVLLTRSRTAMTLHSLLAHVEWSINDQYTVDAGVRYHNVSKDFEHNPLGVRNGNTTTTAPLNIALSESFTEISYTAGISYRVDDEAMLYFRMNQSMRPGGFDGNAVTAEAAAAFDSEKSRNLEFGLKSEWYDDRLRINLAYFQNKQVDKLEQFVNQVVPGRPELVLDNLSRIDNRGFEAEFEWIALSNVYIRGSYSRISSGYETYMVPDWTTGEFVDRVNYSTNWAPHDIFFLSTRYSLNLLGGVVDFFAAYKVLDNYSTNNQLVTGDVLRHGTWDLSLDYTWRDLTVRAFAKNVNNKRFVQNTRQISNGNFVTLNGNSTTSLSTYSEYNTPRFTGVELIYRLGTR